MEKNTGNNKKDSLKSWILLFIIGVLVGAIVSTSSFLVYMNAIGANVNSSNSSSSRMMNGGTPPEMPSDENRQSGTPPEMPNNDNSAQSNN